MERGHSLGWSIILSSIGANQGYRQPTQAYSGEGKQIISRSILFESASSTTRRALGAISGDNT